MEPKLISDCFILFPFAVTITLNKFPSMMVDCRLNHHPPSSSPSSVFDLYPLYQAVALSLLTTHLQQHSTNFATRGICSFIHNHIIFQRYYGYFLTPHLKPNLGVPINHLLCYQVSSRGRTGVFPICVSSTLSFVNTVDPLGSSIAHITRLTHTRTYYEARLKLISTRARILLILSPTFILICLFCKLFRPEVLVACREFLLLVLGTFLQHTFPVSAPVIAWEL